MRTLNTHTPETSYLMKMIKGFNDVLPIISVILSVTMVIGGTMLWYRDSNVSQAAQLQDVKLTVERNKQETEKQVLQIKDELQAIKEHSVNKEVFNNSVNSIEKQLDRIYDKVK